jgi:hypothetical protein
MVPDAFALETRDARSDCGLAEQFLPAGWTGQREQPLARSTQRWHAMPYLAMPGALARVGQSISKEHEHP